MTARLLIKREVVGLVEVDIGVETGVVDLRARDVEDPLGVGLLEARLVQGVVRQRHVQVGGVEQVGDRWSLRLFIDKNNLIVCRLLR